MKQFNPKDNIIESETALAMIEQQQKPVQHYSKYIGLDVHKETIAVAIAPDDGSKPRYYGEIANTPKAIDKLIKKINPAGEVLAICYEAGPLVGMAYTDN